MKYFRMSYEEVVFKRSYINLLLLNAAIPGFKPYDKDGNPKSAGAEKEVHAGSYFLNMM